MNWHCPLPFNSLSSDPQGYYALCCESRPSPHHCQEMTFSEFKQSEYMINVRKGFQSENPMAIPEIAHACEQCKRKEKQGVLSKRQKELKHEIDETLWTNFVELKLIGNICNYACVMCHELSSSKIAEEKKIDLPKWFDLSNDWYDDFAEVSKDYNYFKFSGGEPFMSPTTNKILDVLINSGRSKDIELQFCTNGSPSKKVVKRLLDNFGEIDFCFSIDAWGERNSIIRKHSSWEFTEDRLWDYAELIYNHDNFRMSLNPCISILNIGYLYEFEPFVSQFKFLNGKDPKLTFSVSNTLAYPDELNAIYLPMNVKKQYWNLNKKFLQSDLIRNSEAISVINLLTNENEGNIELLKKGLDKKIIGAEIWYPEIMNQ